MLNSRNIDDLRSDVAANCRVWQKLCSQAGLPVLVTGTVRDEEYQLYCYSIGTSKAKVPSFHSVKAGLASTSVKTSKATSMTIWPFSRKPLLLPRTWALTGVGTGNPFPTGPISSGAMADGTPAP